MQVQSRRDFYQGGEGTLGVSVVTAQDFRVHILSKPSTDVTRRSQAEVSREGVAWRFLCGGREDGETLELVWPQSLGERNGGSSSHLNIWASLRLEKLAHRAGLVCSNTLGRSTFNIF